MKRSLLDQIQAVSGELAQVIPQTAISATDGTTRQLQYIYAAVCDEHVGKFPWQALTVVGSFNTVIGTASYSLPTDFYKMTNNTLWDVTSRRRISGPSSAEVWAFNQGAGVNTTTFTRFRIIGNKIVLSPTPTSVVTINYDYISSWYVVDSGTHMPKQNFTSNADTVLFDDNMIKNALKLRFLETKGLPTEYASVAYNASFDAATSADVPAPTLDMAEDNCNGAFNVPDGSF